MRKCRQCREPIPSKKDCTDPYTNGGFCDIACYGLHKAKKDRESRDKRKRKEHAERKESIKTKAEHARESQAAFNAWIRARDRGLPCISCDKPDDGSHQRHASHYRSRGACPEIAYEPLNVHTSCAQCNTMKSGNILEYRIRLVKKIGQAAVDWLEGPHEAKRYTIDELKEIKARYRRLLRELQFDT